MERQEVQRASRTIAEEYRGAGEGWARATIGKMRPRAGFAPTDSNAVTPRMIEATSVTS